MNVFQALNNAVFVGTLAALLGGLAKMPAPITDRPLTLWLFVAFLFLIRLKIFLDDHKYFSSTETKNPHFKIGFIVGVVSWFFWAFGAWSVTQLQDAYFLVGIAISISTLWIVAVALRAGAYREQYVWIGTNSLFVVLLWVVYRRNMPEGDWVTWIILGLTVMVGIADFALSKSVPELER